MVFLNKVFLIGNLTKDVELRYTPSGVPVAKMRMAVNTKFKTSGGETKEETLFINVVVWRKTAENCAEYLSKGSPVLIEGRLRLNEYEWEGQKRREIEVLALDVRFLPGKRKDEVTVDVDEDVDINMESEDDIPF